MKPWKLFGFILLTMLGVFLADAQDPAETAFDFWVGEWEVSWYGQDSALVKGSNRIEKIMDDKVLQEHFSDPSTGFKGTSISVYNPRTSTWYQSWADNSGGYFHFRGFADGEERMFSMEEPAPNGVLYRMVFTDITSDSLIWTWEGTSDGGESWRTAWQIFYTRKK